MDQHRNIPWTQISIEAVAIVASILLAFSIDAWWDGRQRASVEHQLLDSIKAELSGIRSIHANDYDGVIAVRESVLELLRYSTGVASGLTEGELDSLIADSLWTTMQSNYAAPVLGSIIDSGDLDLISNSEIRLGLAAWEERLEGIRGYIAQDANVLFRRMLPFLQGNGSLLQLLNATDCKPGVPQVCWSYGERIRIPNPLPHSEMVVDLGFQGLLSERLMTLTDLHGLSFRDLDAELKSTIDAISSELEARR